MEAVFKEIGEAETALYENIEKFLKKTKNKKNDIDICNLCKQMIIKNRVFHINSDRYMKPPSKIMHFSLITRVVNNKGC